MIDTNKNGKDKYSWVFNGKGVAINREGREDSGKLNSRGGVEEILFDMAIVEFLKRNTVDADLHVFLFSSVKICVVYVYIFMNLSLHMLYTCQMLLSVEA